MKYLSHVGWGSSFEKFPNISTEILIYPVLCRQPICSFKFCEPIIFHPFSLCNDKYFQPIVPKKFLSELDLDRYLHTAYKFPLNSPQCDGFHLITFLSFLM